MSSSNLSQAPQLMMPHCLVRNIDMKEKLFPAARRDFSEEQLDQIRKTARVVNTEPWRLFEAQHWLEALCDDNVAKVVKKPPALEMVLEMGTCADPGTLPDFSDLLIPEDPVPRVVRVAAKAGAKKRPASNAGGPVLKRPSASEAPSSSRPHAMEGVVAAPPGPVEGPPPLRPSPAAAEPEDPPPPASCLACQQDRIYCIDCLFKNRNCMYHPTCIFN